MKEKSLVFKVKKTNSEAKRPCLVCRLSTLAFYVG